MYWETTPDKETDQEIDKKIRMGRYSLVCQLMTFNPYAAEATFVQRTRMQRFFENHRNPVMLVFIGKLSLSTLRWVPICQGFSDFSGFLHHFVLAKLAASRSWLTVKILGHFSINMSENVWKRIPNQNPIGDFTYYIQNHCEFILNF